MSARSEADEPLMTIPAEEWDRFIRDYDRYNSGDPKMPFVELRMSLANLINCASALAQEPAATVEVPGWISVEQRLPEDRCDVIGYDGQHVYPVHFNRTFHPANAVTHWQPLPNPPASRSKG